MNFSEGLEAQYKDALIKSEGAEERAFREHAWAQFARLGLPDRKNEAWKYSSIAGLTRSAWPLAPASLDIPDSALELISKWKARFEVLIVINGEPRGMAPEGVSVLNFSTRDRIEYEDGWIGLSAALARPGFELRVGRNVKLERPLLVAHVQTGERALSPSLHRVLIADGASAEIAEVFLGESADYFRSTITVADLGAGARLEWLRVQYEDSAANHFSETQCQLGEGAKLFQAQINGGAAWSRSTLRAEIHGEGAEAHIGGLTFARSAQHCDQRVEIRHLAPNTVSQQLFKGVLKDRARGVLNGKIYIAKGAQKVLSSQLNHNLLLTPMAEADTKPELEIFADDVKANHGASVGKLDEDKVFYLMSRGITRADARHMLAEAFVADVLMKIPGAASRALAEASVARILPDFAGEMEASV